MKRRTSVGLGVAFMVLLAAGQAQGQANAANYVFSTTTTGSMVDMSSGTTQLLASNLDDVASAVTPIGFPFGFMGVVQTQFSVNTNGSVRFGPVVISTTAYHPLATAAQSLVTAYGADQRTHLPDGKVHYKVTGAPPNRVLVVEWRNMQANFQAAGTADLTYQVHLYESTGVIEFVYASMAMSATGATDANSNVPHIGFSSNNVAGTVGSVAAPQSGTPAPSYNGASAVPTANLYAAGPITVLTSVADGSRRTFALTPPVPTAPTGLSFTGVTQVGMTLNWTDSPNELAYAIYSSTDGGTTFAFAGSAAQNATNFVAAGLAPGTTYNWQVFAVSEGAYSAPLSGAQATNAPTGVLSTGAGGNWSAAATWAGGVVPAATDNVTIAAGTTVTIDTAAVAYTVTVVGTGTLQWDPAVARTLTVGTNVTIQSGGTFQSAVSGVVTTHSLSLGGNLTNDGTLDFSTNANTAGATITFTGATNTTFSGTGAVTDIRQIAVNKGSSADSVVEVMPTNFTVQGVTTDVAGWLVTPSVNGALKLSGTFTGTNRVFTAAGYTIGATSGFWLNNPNYTVAGQNGSPTNSGLLRISQGTFNVGTAAGNTMGGSAGAVFTIEGGSLNVTGRLNSANAVIYNQSGGTVSVLNVASAASTAASFGLTSASSQFNMSGGTIALVQANSNATPLDFQVSSGGAPTGGTLQVGTGATAAVFTFRIRGNVPNLLIDTTTNTKSVTLANTTIVFLGNVTVPPTSTLTLNGFVLQLPGNLLNNGTINGTTVGSRINFVAASQQTYSGSGVAGTPVAPMAGFGVSNPGGLSVQAPIATLRVNLFNGPITGSGLITLGGGAATTTTVQISQAASPVSGGSFDVSPTWNLGTGGEVVLYLQEPVMRTTGFEISPTRSLFSMTVDNTNHVTIAGGDITLTNTAAALTMTNGRIVTGPNTLALASGTATVTRTNGYVDGNFKKNFAAAANKIFEVGTANGYSPVSQFNVTAGTFPIDVTVKATQTTAPGLVPTTTAITRYWTLTVPGAPGTITADVTFTYLDPTDIPGTATEANFKLFRQDPGVFTNVGGVMNAPANTAQVLGATQFSNWTVAEAAFPAPTAAASGDATICAGSSTIIQAALTGTQPWSITWSDTVTQSGITTSPATRSVSPGGNTTYTVTAVSDANGAGTASGSATITVNPIPSTPTATNGGPYCEGTTLALSTPTVSGATYAWTGPNGFTSSLQNPTRSSLTTADAGTYSVTDTVSGCTSAAGTTNVTVNPLPATPTATPGGPTTFCQGGSVTLTSSSVSGNQWYLNAGAIGGATGTTYNATATGNYTVVTTDGNGCASAPSSAVSVTATPDSTAPNVTAPGNITINQTVCCGVFGGVLASEPAIVTFLGGATATDDCVATPTQLPPQLLGTDVTPATCFVSGVNTVTFRFQDLVPNTGSATATVTVRMFGDLDLDNAAGASDLVAMRGYLNLSLTPGTPPFNAPLALADLNHDGFVDASDLIMLRSFIDLATTCVAP